MMDPDLIDPNILVIVEGLEEAISEKEIIDSYVVAGFEQGDIFLLMTAAKIIHHDRVTAVRPTPVFRRVK